MAYGGKYIRIVASLTGVKWKIKVFQFITMVSNDVLDEPLGFITGDPTIQSELDPFDFTLRPETVDVSIVQPIDPSYSIYGMVKNNDYTTNYLSHTKSGFYVEIEEILTGTKWWYKHRRDQISRELKKDGTQLVKLVFYNGITEAENLKQWDPAGTSRNSAWTTIFQAGVYKTVRQYVESICSGSVDSDFGSVLFSKPHQMKFRRSGSGTDHGIDNIYIPGDFFLTGTSPTNSVHKTGADVLKDIQLAFCLNIQWNGLNKLFFHQSFVEYGAESFYPVNVSETIQEEPLYFQKEGVLISLKDQSSTPKWFHSTFGDVYLENNQPADKKNCLQKVVRIYNDLTGSSFSPGCGMYIGEPVGAPTSFYPVSSVNGYTTNSEALLNLFFIYDPLDRAFLQSKGSGFKTPTFGQSIKPNFAGVMRFELSPGDYYEGKVFKLKRGIISLMDELEIYTHTI